jgi:hypothetical protein
MPQLEPGFIEIVRVLHERMERNRHVRVTPSFINPDSSCPALCSLVPGIHVFLYWGDKGVDGRDKPGHDVERSTIMKLGIISGNKD